MSGGWGSQRPRILSVPEYASSSGREAVELAALAGLELDPWQQLVVQHGLGERADGSWSAFEVGVEVSRQNGKGGCLEARELAGLFLFGERLIVHSAHEFSTAEEALERMAIIFESCPDFDRRVKSIKRSHGQEGIYLKGGQRLRYRTRTKGGGRGLSADLVVLDEAMHIPEAMLNALFPTLSARENPQLWYAGSAVDQESMPDGVVFARLRERALRGGDPSLAYFGWEPENPETGEPFEHPSEVSGADARSPVVWGQSNPALGIRITPEYIASEQRSMSARGFAVERLGVGDWPVTDPNPDRVISDEAWAAVLDALSIALDPVCFAVDVSPNRSTASIGVAGRRPDGLSHIEVVESGAGTGWVVDRVKGLVGRHRSVGVMYDEASPAAALVSQFEQKRVKVVPVSAREHARACGMIFDAVGDATVRHLGSPELDAAVRGAVKRPLGDAWAWSRSNSQVDITPLVACTLALYGLETLRPPSPRVVSLADALS